VAGRELRVAEGLAGIEERLKPLGLGSGGFAEKTAGREALEGAIEELYALRILNTLKPGESERAVKALWPHPLVRAIARCSGFRELWGSNSRSTGRC